MIRNLPQSLIDTASKILQEGYQNLRNEMSEKFTQQNFIGEPTKQHITNQDKIFGSGVNRVEIPLGKNLPDSVSSFIVDNGDIPDHNKKTATLKSGREVDISKYLARAKAPKEIRDDFENHDRNTQTEDDTKVVLSRVPGEYSSASCETNWESCAKPSDLGKNLAADKLKSSFSDGSMIALHLSNDTQPEHFDKKRQPEYNSSEYLGREMVHSFHDGKGNTIYAREGKTYGEMPESARSEIDKLLDKHNSTMPSGVYYKSNDAYHDGGKHTILHKFDESHIVDRLTSDDSDKVINTFESIDPKPHHVDIALSHNNPEINYRVSTHAPNLIKAHHIDTMLNALDKSTSRLGKPYLSTAGGYRHLESLLNHPKANEDHFKFALERKPNLVVSTASKNFLNDNLTHAHLRSADLASILPNNKKYDNYTPKHADMIIDNLLNGGYNGESESSVLHLKTMLIRHTDPKKLTPKHKQFLEDVVNGRISVQDSSDRNIAEMHLKRNKEL